MDDMPTEGGTEDDGTAGGDESGTPDDDDPPEDNDSPNDGSTATSSDASSTSGDPETDGSSSSGAERPTYTRIELDFDELADGEVVTDQYAEYGVISSSPGCSFEVTSAAGTASSEPYYVFAYYSCDTAPNAPFYIDFAAPVRAPSITLAGVNNSGVVGTVRLLAEDGSVVVEEAAMGLGDPYEPVVLTFADASDITRLEVVDVDDSYGLGFDDLAFDFPDGG